jgi:hypothetical protein
VVTYDPAVAGGTLTLYVNGQQAGSTSGYAAFKAVGGLVAGRAQYGGGLVDYWTGGIDNVSVYGRAIAGSEVTALYDAGRPNILVPTLLASNDGTTTTGCVTDASHPAISASATPTLSASVSEPDPTVAVHADFELRDVSLPVASPPITLGGTGSASGTGPNVQVTTSALTSGHEYAFAARGDDGNGAISAISQSCYLQIGAVAATAAGEIGESGMQFDNAVYPASAGAVSWPGPSTTLVWQTDGNLVVYRNNGQAVWSSNTAGNTSAVLVRQNDGNLVIYAYQPTIAANGWVSGLPLWASGTSGKGANNLVVQGDGNVVISGPSGALWATATVVTVSDFQGTAALISANDTKQEYFARGTNGHLWHWYWTGAGGLVSEDWGGDLAGTPFTYTTPGVTHVFGRGSDGHLHHWYWSGTGSVGYQDWGGDLAGNPTGYYVGNLSQQDVFGRGSDGHLHHWYWNSTAGNQYQDWGGSIVGDPTGFWYSSGQEQAFAIGTDGHLHQWIGYSGGVATGDWGPASLAGNPTAILSGSQQDIFGVGTDGHLHHWYWNPTTNAVLTQDWGGTAAGTPAATYSDGANRVDVFARGTDGTLHHWSGAPTTSTPIVNTWGASLTGDPTATLNGANRQLDVYARNSTGTATHWWQSGDVVLGNNDWGGQIAP